MVTMPPDVGHDPLVQRGHGGAHPVGLLRVRAEFLRVAEGGVLRGDLLPQIPAIAGVEHRVQRSGLVLRTDGAVLDAAAVCDEDQIVFRKVNAVFLAVVNHFDALCGLLAVAAVKDHVRDLRAEMELHAVALEVLHHRQDHRLILVVLREAKGLEVGQTSDVVDIALNVELHLQRAVPVFKGEHCSPVEPEI